MANPSYYQQTSPAVTSVVQHLEHRFHMYAHQQYGKNEHTIVLPKELPNHFGSTNVVDWGLLDAPRIGATVIGQLQGLAIAAGISSEESWYTSFNLVFTDQRFKGSTLSVQGPLGPPRLPDEGAWAVVGGTGEFAYAKGIVAYKRVQHDPETGFMIELNIRVSCLTTMPKPAGAVATKIGTWGGNAGQARDITKEPPKRLESITISSGDVVDSIAFSYVDQAGQKHTAGPWGGNGGNRTMIQLSDSEFVKEVSGTFATYVGNIVVISSIKIVTNVKTYGPLGREDGTTFIVALPGNSAVVGFFGRSGQFLDAIGVYVHPL